MYIRIKSIPYKEQRYPTCGDYWIDKNGVKQFRVNDMGNEDYHFLVSIHEQIEEYLTQRRGLKESDIMAFDVMFEKEREEGKHAPDDEPGDDPSAPYHHEHVFAETIERLLAIQMDVNWAEYGKAIEKSCD
jgi:hypothetical protein